MNAPTSLHAWDGLRQSHARRLARAASQNLPRQVPADRIIALLEAVIEPGDRVCLEGNNQKQADFLAESLADCNPEVLHHLQMLLSVLALPSHVDLFERGLARRLDFSFSGPQGSRLASLVQERRIEIGAIHTYLELFGRHFIDLTPNVCLIAAQAADAAGNLYTGPNTEDTPAIVEATAFKGGIVVAQVNELREDLPRVDVPASWVDFVVLGAPPELHRALVYPRPGPDHRSAGADGDDGHQGHLVRRPLWAASPASAGRPIWVPIHTAGATPARPGSRPAGKRQAAAPSEAASWSCRWSRPSASIWRRYSSTASMPGPCRGRWAPSCRRS